MENTKTKPESPPPELSERNTVLTLTRKEGDFVVIGKDLFVDVVEISDKKVVLELSRKLLEVRLQKGEKVKIDKDIELLVDYVGGNKLSLKVQAPPDVRIYRGEIFQKIQEEEENENHPNSQT